MNHALITIKKKGKETEFIANWGTNLETQTFDGPSVDVFQRWADDAAKFMGYSSYVSDEDIWRWIRNTFQGLKFDFIESATRQWVASSTGPNVMCVFAEDEIFQQIPWELIPRFYGRDDFLIVRVASDKQPKPKDVVVKKALIAGWMVLELPGIDREINTLPSVFHEFGVKSEVLSQPRIERFHERLASSNPELVHLSFGSVIHDESKIMLPFSTTDMIDTSDFSSIMQEAKGLKFAMLNACGGHVFASQLCKAIESPVVSWFGVLNDDLAADFSSRFYKQLFDQQSIAGALNAVISNRRRFDRWDITQIPVAWYPNYGSVIARFGLEVAEKETAQQRQMEMEEIEMPNFKVPMGRNPILDDSFGSPTITVKPDPDFDMETMNRSLEPGTANVEGDRAMPTPTNKPPAISVNPFTPSSPLDDFNPLKKYSLDNSDFTEIGKVMKGRGLSTPDFLVNPAPPAISVEIEEFKPRTINPALLKCGHPTIDSLRVHSTHELDGVLVEIICDTGKSFSRYSRTIDLERQPVSIPLDQACFPNLYELIENSAGRRRISFTVRISKDEDTLAQQTESVDWMDVRDWVDRRETWAYLPAFVQPQSNGVLQVIDEAAAELRSIAGPNQDFTGYQGEKMAAGPSNQTAKIQFAESQVKAIYQTLRDRLRIRYVSAGGAIWESKQYAGQIVRLADNVIERKRGTCHDLALLFAGCMENVQIHPLIMLARGHTLIGFWRHSDFRTEFWDSQQLPLRESATNFGRTWVITNLETILELQTNNKIRLIESTSLSKNDTFDQAKNAGRNLIDQSIQDLPFDAAIDIYQARRNGINFL